MRIFLDSSKVDEILKWYPVIKGVTTNPSILKKDGGDVFEIAKIVKPYPISIEACGDFLTDARYYAKGIPNVVVKIPLITTSGGLNIPVIHQLVEEGIRVNCTALMSAAQVALVSQLGIRYASIFAGRVDDEGGDYKRVIRSSMQCLRGAGTELIVGSVRTVGNVLDAIESGADIITITPSVLEKMFFHNYSLKTVQEFEDAYKRISQ